MFKKGYKQTPEHRQNISKAHLGKKQPNISKALKGEGHPMYGKHLSEEQCKKISESTSGEKHWNYGKHPSGETRKKMSESQMGHQPSEKTRKKLSISLQGNQNALGFHHTEEQLKKMSKAVSGKNNPNWQGGSKQKYCIDCGVPVRNGPRCRSCANKGERNGFYGKSNIPWNKGKPWSEEHRQKLSAAQQERFKDPHEGQKISEGLKGNQCHLGHTHSKEVREVMSKAKVAYMKTPEGQAFYERFSQAGRQAAHSEESRRKMSETHTAQAKTPKGKAQIAKWCLAGRRALHGSPSKGEYHLKEILDTVDPGWIHNSAQDHPIFVNGKEPDFLRDHKIIELFGEHWHDETDEPERKEIFEHEGYDCLVIWSKEFRDLDILHRKILEFVGASGQ